MMNINEFVKAIENEVSKKLGNDFTVTAVETLANNGGVRNQLCIGKNNSHICPSIHLEEFFEEYKEGLDLHTVADNLLAYYGSVTEVPDCIKNMGNDLSFERLKSKIMFKLINTYDNAVLLQEIPSVPFLDMSIVFYVYLGEDDEGVATALIRNQHLKYWQISIDELYQTALNNMPKIFSPILYRIEDCLFGDLQENLLEKKFAFESAEEDIPMMLVLSTKNSMYGAAVLLYPGILDQCREIIGDDFMILPSSVHELILFSAGGCGEPMDSKELADMIQHINATELHAEERLSDHAYKYCYDDNQVICA